MVSLKKFLDPSKKILKKSTKLADQILAKDSEFRQLSDEALKLKTVEFKERFKNGETLDDLLVEAFATVREAASRVLGQKPYKVQLIGGIILHYGNISEMKTGEGKTLTSTLPAYLNALTGAGVHIVTVNDYLAKRDATEMGELFNWLGLSVGLNTNQLSQREKKEQYLCDITYTTNNELGFDYLRDHMVNDLELVCQRPLNYAIIDEVDSILIDEARTPLIISGGQKEISQLYQKADLFVKKLSKDKDYDLDIKAKNVQLTPEGMDKAEKFFSVNNLYDIENAKLLHHINNALKAHFIMIRDVDYLVKNNEIIIIDQFTGRLMEGRTYSEGLHQAIQAKENVKIKEETQTLATITFQNLFRLYNKLGGMTGTAKTEEEEFRNIYNMVVVEVPTNRPIQRIDQTDLIFQTFEAILKAVVEDVKKRHEVGQPILLGTVAVETSELISDILKKNNIPHNVLNAKNHEKEAELIKDAGQPGAVTIATNMAGRGTDIKISEEVKKLGGLAVIGTERHESRRIDNQLRGRSGRQGDPGFTQFYLSFEDELMKRFLPDRVIEMIDTLELNPEEAIENKLISRAVESAQKRVEGNNYDIRKTVIEYDDVIRSQREKIYNKRQQILEQDDLSELMEEIFYSIAQNLTNRVFNDENARTTSELLDYLNKNFFALDPLPEGLLENETEKQVREIIFRNLSEFYHKRKEMLASQYYHQFEKMLMIQIIDTYWMAHIDTMDALRQGIHLRSYGQVNPLHEYQQEGAELFQNLITRIEEEIVTHLFRSEIRVEVQQTTA